MHAQQQMQEPNESGGTLMGGVEQFESVLANWRAHVDEFLVQLDLAHMELWDNVALTREASTSLGPVSRGALPPSGGLSQTSEKPPRDSSKTWPRRSAQPGTASRDKGAPTQSADRTMVLSVGTMVPTRKGSADDMLEA